MVVVVMHLSAASATIPILSYLCRVLAMQSYFPFPSLVIIFPIRPLFLSPPPISPHSPVSLHPSGLASGIETRHMAMTEAHVSDFPAICQFGAPSLSSRQDILRHEGVQLAAAACERALGEWGGNRADVTHLVAVTVSGVHLPGLDLQLVKALGLGRGTQRVLLQMLGCYAGVTALRGGARACCWCAASSTASSSRCASLRARAWTPEGHALS